MTHRRPEQQLQKAVVGHLQWHAVHDAWFCAIPNGGQRSAVEGAIFKGLGVVAGAPDLLIVRDGKARFLELKAPRGRLTDAQRECHDRLRRAGAEVATATGIDEALAVLADWQLLRGRNPARPKGDQCYARRYAAAAAKSAVTPSEQHRADV